VRLTIFGGTGRTGQLLVQQALAAGHEITLLVRDPSKAAAQSPKLHVLVGSIHNAADIEQAISGAEAVISVLGPSSNKPLFEISAAMAQVIALMGRNGPRRLIVSIGAGVRDAQDTPPPADRIMGVFVKTLSANVYEDMLRVNNQVRASALSWTIVRVPRLVDGPYTGKVRAGFVGKGVGMSISRADLAGFMLHQLDDATYLRQAPAISN
jgi:putative NADH-flavin reductase